MALFHPMRTLTAVAAGAAAAYFLDPERGEERRAQANEQIRAKLGLSAQESQELQELS